VNDHHLILGRLVDYLDGGVIDDTHDERYRQKVARLLVETKGYAKSDIAARCPITVRAGGKAATVPVTFVVRVDGWIGMLVHYGPGSLVTRHRPALAMGRLLAPCQVPVVVVTNGEEADILDGASGKCIGRGLEELPSREQLMAIVGARECRPVGPERAEKEARILMAFEVDDRCPCDNTVSSCGLNLQDPDIHHHGS